MSYETHPQLGRGHPRCRIEIAAPVAERIRATVEGSRIEEGGKFFGHVTERDGEIVLRVETFVDSGPDIDHSATHIFPDGEYQERVFRVIEHFVPTIEHNGTWHTHHCNGLDTLSGGDIQGYFRTVNDPNYGPKHFFALLITANPNGRLRPRYYLFTKRQQYFWEIPGSAVSEVPGTFAYEGLMRELERLSFAARRDNTRPRRRQVQERRAQHEEDPLLREFRREDKEWLKRHFPDVQAVQSKRDGSFAWKWAMTLGPVPIQARYAYPARVESGALPPATLELSHGSNRVAFAEIPLNAERANRIVFLIRELEAAINNLSHEQDAVTDQPQGAVELNHLRDILHRFLGYPARS